MCTKNPVALVACVLVVVGALNWGLVGLSMLLGGSNWNVVSLLLSKWPVVEAVVYVLVGLAGLYKFVMCSKSSDSCCN